VLLKVIRAMYTCGTYRGLLVGKEDLGCVLENMEIVEQLSGHVERACGYRYVIARHVPIGEL
jgi:hypothetical protein